MPMLTSISTPGCYNTTTLNYLPPLFNTFTPYLYATKQRILMLLLKHQI